MSDSIPSSSLSRKRSKRRYDKTKLPTPPPDPAAPEKDDFLAYLDSLQKSSLVYNRSTSYAPVLATEDAFDHLEKLYKLMEQMLELREQNARLHRRVRDLEHLNNLEKMHKELGEHLQDDCPELDKDTAFAETILESILSDSKSPKVKPAAPAKLRQSMSRRRSRSGSVSAATVRHLQPPEMRVERRASDGGSGVKKPSKVSKWTKVKAAFKWEKAAPTVSDAKSQDSGIGGMVGAAPVEVARYLRVPSCGGGGGIDDHGHSPVDSGAAEVSTPGTLSTASSVEDFHRHETRSHCEDFKSSDDEHSHTYIPHSKEGSQKSNKSHKTPWAKMKDIIQTRNSFKKKHRLSAQSDDIQIDVELCTDNEDNVFEEERVCGGMDEGGIPLEIVARYQRAISEDGADSKKVSKWTRVKKAFLPPPESFQAPVSPHGKDEDKIEDEIQHSYKQLQKKLSLEFQEKLSEWERMKQSSPNPSNPSSSCGFVEEAKDPAFLKKMEEWQKIKSQPSVKRPNVQMTSEENLPPEFRKKLQEWEKIRKGSGSKKKLSEVPRWKSLSGPKCESPNPEYPNLSEDFRKKLEEWKQIKSASPKQPRKESSSPKHSKKQKDELQWFEKELGKIEKEKQRLERERQKFLEREEALSKLRNSVLGGLKKEVLIHTPSGFYRFEGISRKFTQKLYEWEKAKGIAPESSTFALLNSSLSQDSKTQKKKAPNSTPNLMRSKSADSIAISALNLACPLMSHQPSSLSLNDVEELEKECLEISRSSSEKFGHSRETLNEPEALIVEIEDIVEETAGALDAFAQRSQQPVYQRQELKLCEGETCAAPKVRRSESTRAQNNYNLIEEIFSILKNLMENETEIQRLQDQIPEEGENNSILIRLKMFDESQKAMSIRLNEKILRLQEANSEVFASLSKDQDFGPKQVLETLENIQDLSTEIYQLTDKLDVEVVNRNVYEPVKKGACSLNPVPEIAREIKNKMLELRRRLSYICAASDLTAPRRRPSSPKKKKKNEDSGQNPKEGRLYIKADSSNTQSQGAIKKRIRYRQKSQQSRALADTDEEEDDPKRNTHKKLTRTRSISEGSTKEEVIVDESIIQKVVVPTQSNIVNACPDEDMKIVDSPVTVFVKTTRRLFTPLVESSLKEEEQKAREEIESKTEEKNLDTTSENSSNLTSPNVVTHLPPLPSPILMKKTKDISPSIRIMMAKYNQKISEDSHSAKSGNSSGSASPVAWRSPSFERRVKAQTERYQEELKKSSPLLVRKEVQKSASVGFLSKEVVPPRQGQSGVQRILSEPTNKIFERADGGSKRLSSELRSQKIQKAKEDFLNSSPKSVPVELKETPFQFPPRSRLSQISMDSSSSYDSSTPGALIKSASAGMINIDAESYKQFDPEMHGGGYVSLPRNTKKPKEGILGGKFAFSNIASKFRKVKMRKGKDKMGAVSALCRQSLVVDIQPLLGADGGEEKKKSGEEKDAGGWMKKSKLFKK